MKKIKLIIIVVLSAVLSTSFLSNYFEITKNLEIFNNIYRELETSYVENINPGDLMKKAIDRMLETLDPWTVYIPESEIEDFRTRHITGDYGGIGSGIRKLDDFVVITEPFKNSPADLSGLKIGDKIVSINGEDMEKESTENVSNLLKGTPGTSVTVTIERNNAVKKMEITRDKIHNSTVPHYEMIEDEIGYIKLNKFQRKSALEIKNALKELDTSSNNNLNGLILDLRDNGGGVLSQCLEIVNLFIPKGDTMLIAKGKDATWDKEYISSQDPLYENLPIVVLINERSASASEIVAGCLQDLDRGIVLGKTSFGKGLIQQNKKIAYNTQLKVTVAKYYTPSGRCIQKIDTDEKQPHNTDSLQSVFFTKNGRKVFGGGGIDPDVDIEEQETLPMLISLFQKNCIFNFGNQFFESINFPDSPKEFALSDDEYNQFKKYLENNNFPFSMYSEEVLKELKESLEKESYFEDMKDEFKILEKSILNNKKQDLIRYEDEIREIISKDLILRQFYRSGMIEYSLKNDNFMAKALELIKNTDEYNNILSVK
ncbi:MAG: peptidase S41 [Flavobacteriales bacterium]|nr:peptidase S41 [Flavobacteriales bacterium]